MSLFGSEFANDKNNWNSDNWPYFPQHFFKNERCFSFLFLAYYRGFHYILHGCDLISQLEFCKKIEESDQYVRKMYLYGELRLRMLCSFLHHIIYLFHYLFLLYILYGVLFCFEIFSINPFFDGIWPRFSANLYRESSVTSLLLCCAWIYFGIDVLIFFSVHCYNSPDFCIIQEVISYAYLWNCFPIAVLGLTLQSLIICCEEFSPSGNFLQVEIFLRNTH